MGCLKALPNQKMCNWTHACLRWTTNVNLDYKFRREPQMSPPPFLPATCSKDNEVGQGQTEAGLLPVHPLWDTYSATCSRRTASFRLSASWGLETRTVPTPPASKIPVTECPQGKADSILWCLNYLSGFLLLYFGLELACFYCRFFEFYFIFFNHL